MKNTIKTSICVALISLYSFCITSCSGNNSGNKTADSTTKAGYPKMTARERLKKNRILEKNLTLSSYNLNSNVKSVTKTLYDIASNEQETFNSKNIIVFNSKGYLIEIDDDYNPSQHIANSMTKIMYDANNNDTCRITYNADGKITGRLSNIYDSKGNEIGYTYYNAEGKMEHKRVYKYDDNDNLVEFDNYLESGALNDKRTYTYDENGFKTGEFKYDRQGKSYLYEKCQYDNKGNQLYNKSNYYVDENNNIIDSNKYDADGHIVEGEQYSGTGNLIAKYKLKFDSLGNNTEYGVYKMSYGAINEYTMFKQYKYDAKGNIVKESHYMMSKDGVKRLTQITESVIVYY